MLKTRVILAEVINLSDARYAAGMGVDYIGFAVNPANSRFVTPDQAGAITEWLSGVGIIGDIGPQPPANLDAYPLNLVQTNNPALIDSLPAKPILSTVYDEHTPTLLAEATAKTEFFIVKCDNVEPRVQELTLLCQQYPVYLATDYNNQTLATVLEQIKPTGMVLYGSEEEKPGFSSYDGIADILEQLEED